MPRTTLPALNGNYQVDNVTLNRNLMASRTIKTSKEATLMQLVSEIGSEAHEFVMKNAKGNSIYEFRISSLFQYYSYNCGLRHQVKSLFSFQSFSLILSFLQAYSPITAGNNNSAILHYVENNKEITDGILVLIDAGKTIPFRLF